MNEYKQPASDPQPGESGEGELFDQLLDDLNLLQQNLMHGDSSSVAQPDAEDALPATDHEGEGIDSLEIPILTQSLNREIDSEHESRKVFDEAQHHLFEAPGTPKTISEEQVNAIVSKLMGRLKPRVEQLLREKIRAKVIARFNQQS